MHGRHVAQFAPGIPDPGQEEPLVLPDGTVGPLYGARPLADLAAKRDVAPAGLLGQFPLCPRGVVLPVVEAAARRTPMRPGGRSLVVPEQQDPVIGIKHDRPPGEPYSRRVPWSAPEHVFDLGQRSHDPRARRRPPTVRLTPHDLHRVDAHRDGAGAETRLVVDEDGGIRGHLEPVQGGQEDLRRRLGRPDLARQDQSVGERVHAELHKQRAGGLGAVADDRDLDTADPEPVKERDGVVVQVRVLEQQLLVPFHHLADKAGPRLLTVGPQDLPESLGLRDPAIGQRRRDPLVRIVPGLGRDASQS
jgi:hypothetical protein